MSIRHYHTLNFPDSQPGDKTLLTGIRYYCKNYYITGFYEPISSSPTSFLYVGKLDGSGVWHRLNYPGPNQTSLYGPDICKCCGHVTLVGNYGTEGVIYEGKFDESGTHHGSGRWSLVSPPDAIGTIWHSVYNNVVVGNYKLADDPRNYACVYDKKRGFTTIPHHESITAYGIWQKKCKFTICGGTPTRGYLVNYDRCSRNFSNWRYYAYPEATETHFDGISSGVDASWSLTGTSNIGAFQADITCEEATWSDVAYPGAATTTGNSVYKNVVIGVYTVADVEGVNGFVSW